VACSGHEAMCAWFVEKAFLMVEPTRLVTISRGIVGLRCGASVPLDGPTILALNLN